MQEPATVQTLIERFTEKEIRLTPQRINVYKYILEHNNHPTIDMVYHALKEGNPSLSKTTIYNIVEVLGKEKLIRVIRIADGDVRLDGELDQHAHFHCKECGQILNLYLENLVIPPALNGFRIDEYDIYAAGSCPSCLKK